MYLRNRSVTLVSRSVMHSLSGLKLYVPPMDSQILWLQGSIVKCVTVVSMPLMDNHYLPVPSRKRRFEISTPMCVFLHWCYGFVSIPCWLICLILEIHPLSWTRLCRLTSTTWGNVYCKHHTFEPTLSWWIHCGFAAWYQREATSHCYPRRRWASFSLIHLLRLVFSICAVVTLYSTSGAKGARHDWIDKVHSVGEPSYLMVQLYAHSHGCTYTSLACKSLESNSFLRVPRTHILFSFPSNSITRKDISSDAAHPMTFVTLPPQSTALFLILISNAIRIDKAIKFLGKVLKGKESTEADELVEGYSGDGESSESEVDAEF